MKRIMFITGTRADFGKLKSLIKAVEHDSDFEACVFVTGMHLLTKYGYTVSEIYNELKDKKLISGQRVITTYMNQFLGESMDRILANTIHGLSRCVEEYRPDMMIVHGDRVEALAGAIVGTLRDILVAHVEGGELSGTVDEIIRHSITKLSHIHFVANDTAANRLSQLGEDRESIFVIGSPDIDIMLRSDLPSLYDVKEYYQIPFEQYALLIFHPVTTDRENSKRNASETVSAILESDLNFVVIYPNNDEGCSHIFSEYERFNNNPRIIIRPSLRMEYFLVLLKNTSFIIGNSSVGIREAPIYGTYSINISTRQTNRFYHESIVNVSGDKFEILKAIKSVYKKPKLSPCYHFGIGNSAELFSSAIRKEDIWQISKQKQFIDIPESVLTICN
jgi:UDP-N-acetylglucosamine 2-epimerase (hydrolysing)